MALAAPDTLAPPFKCVHLVSTLALLCLAPHTLSSSTKKHGRAPPLILVAQSVFAAMTPNIRLLAHQSVTPSAGCLSACTPLEDTVTVRICLNRLPLYHAADTTLSALCTSKIVNDYRAVLRLRGHVRHRHAGARAGDGQWICFKLHLRGVHLERHDSYWKFGHGFHGHHPRQRVGHVDRRGVGGDRRRVEQQQYGILQQEHRLLEQRHGLLEQQWEW
ncbi:hypothetical protein B0H10DRAFT_2209834 [Mycena sp. CBHHK59/15]|nr:hypothetical protein B0H10DRAFT_2209834 [Mycena sp. CBHHK59/15]